MAALLIGLAQVAIAEAAKPEEVEFFEKQVRPVLVANCFNCHGPQKQMSGLRLDSREGVLKGGENGPIVVPGDDERSPMIEAVRQVGPIHMPPEGRLEADQVASLARWVKMGVPWPEEAKVAGAKTTDYAAIRVSHWAFQPVKRPPLPTVKHVDWARSPIDAFILARLEATGLAPSPPANPVALCRRVYFDLIGLPPTPEEVDQFVRHVNATKQDDDGELAYQALVNRLLDSPHYGERWGRYWLDVARYADTKGYIFFGEKEFPWSYTYRDYVIRAFNEDLPYDQFVLEQLAADRLPLGHDKRALAAMGFVTVGGRFMENPYDIIDDRIDVVARGLLGLTVTCARCHDHKFDPIPTQDYYSLYGVFASCVEPNVPPLFTNPPKTAGYAAFELELRLRESKLAEFVVAKHAEVVTGARTRAGEYMLAANVQRNQPKTDDFMLLADGGDLNPKMILRWQVYLEKSRRRHDPIFAPWQALADLKPERFANEAPAVIARFESAAPERSVNPIILEALGAKSQAKLEDTAKVYGELFQEVERRWQEAKRARPEAMSLPDPNQEALRQVLYGPDSPPMVPMNPAGDLELLPDRPAQAKLKELLKSVDDWRAKGTDAPPRAMVLEDLPTPIHSRVFLRGNPNQLGDDAPRRFLAVLSGNERPAFRQGSGRLELAQAIVDRRNPLTARVFVNRLWLHHFGAGLVRTPSDFGLRSDPPSHPELLDFLASEFMEGGWSIKPMHRMILLSSTYRQKSDDREDARWVDPENTLVWKMNRRRLDFEALRDSLLAVSGTLDRTIGGPSVKDTLSPGGKRRTIYGFLDRLNVPGLWRTFDFPSPDATSALRDVTTVAPQALFMMNHPLVIESAKRTLARPEIAATMEAPAKTTALYRLLYGREPTAEEQKWAVTFVKSQADWPVYVQALLVANEFVFID